MAIQSRQYTESDDELHNDFDEIDEELDETVIHHRAREQADLDRARVRQSCITPMCPEVHAGITRPDWMCPPCRVKKDWREKSIEDKWGYFIKKSWRADAFDEEYRMNNEVQNEADAR